jgi:N,N'-diacetyllegionaminate synthase
MPLLRRAAKTGVPLIISTGMAHFHEVMESVEIVRSSGAEDVAVLHCTSLYPAPPETLNLRVIPELEKKLDCPIGYSDHFDGKLASVAAVAAGAVIIEKHFTLDRTKAGEDHAISLEPSAFKEMVADIRGVEKMLGSSEKTPHPIEVENRAALHRRITAYRDIERGEVITEEDLLMMRLPPDLSGIRANQIDEIVGAKAARPIAKLRGLSLEDVEERS